MQEQRRSKWVASGNKNHQQVGQLVRIYLKSTGRERGTTQHVLVQVEQNNGLSNDSKIGGSVQQYSSTAEHSSQQKLRVKVYSSTVSESTARDLVSLDRAQHSIRVIEHV